MAAAARSVSQSRPRERFVTASGTGDMLGLTKRGQVLTRIPKNGPRASSILGTVNIRSQLRNFWRAFRHDDEPVKRFRHSGHSLAKTLGDASHVSSGQGPGGGAAGGSGTTGAIGKMAAGAHERYTDSFDD